MLVMFLALQSAPQTYEVVTPPDRAMASFDLAKVKSAPDEGCRKDGIDILICSRRAGPPPFVEHPEFEEKPLRVGVDLGRGARGSIETEQRSVGGIPSNAIKAKLKIGF